MANFFVKYKKGEVKHFDVSPKTLSQGVCEYEFNADVDYSALEYVEYPLHDFEIKAGDDGFFLIPAGNKDIASHFAKNEKAATKYYSKVTDMFYEE